MFDELGLLDDAVRDDGAVPGLTWRPGAIRLATRPEIVCEGGGCSGRCGTCRAACTKVANHHGDHYCTVHGAYPDN